MRLRTLLATAGLCLFGILGNAWAAVDADASAACLECHEEDLQSYSKSPHAAKVDPRAPTCVSCHGPSTAHLKKPEGGKRPPPDRRFVGRAAIDSADASAVCQTCHQREKNRALWSGSQHDTAGVACNACHKVHTNSDRALAKRTQSEVCFTCHKDQRSQIQKVSRHPILEGKMSCSDCHNVHGSTGPKLVRRDSVNDTCYLCHAEKRGPFVHNHQPVTEDCGNCHNPHGSTLPSMLTMRPPVLCQQCHTPHGPVGSPGAVGGQPGVFPPPVAGQTASAVNAASGGKNVVNFWQGRSCMGCHTQVHGSNNPSATNPTPAYQFR
jgi:DmsE family decaheme c-type cytochrome